MDKAQQCIFRFSEKFALDSILSTILKFKFPNLSEEIIITMINFVQNDLTKGVYIIYIYIYIEICVYIYISIPLLRCRLNGLLFRVSGPTSDEISHRRATASRRGLKPARSGLGAVLRSSWAPRGPSWGRLGASLDLLGAILGSCKRFRSEESDIAKSVRFP